MAEPVGEDRQLKTVLQYDPGYRVVAANAAWIGMTPRNDIQVDFVIERIGNPDEIVHLVTSDNKVGPELRRSPPEMRVVRHFQMGVLMSPDAADGIADHIKKTVQQWRSKQSGAGSSEQ